MENSSGCDPYFAESVNKDMSYKKKEDNILCYKLKCHFTKNVKNEITNTGRETIKKRNDQRGLQQYVAKYPCPEMYG